DIIEKVVTEIEAEEEVENPMVTELDLPVEEIETEDEEVSEVPAKGREEAVSSSETGGAGAFMAIGAGGGAAGAFGNRNGGGRKRAVGRYGGSKASESAVEAALRWFARHQSPNGQWDVDGYPQNCPLPGAKCEPGKAHTGADGDIATTGYAVLCFLGAGYDHRTPNKWRKVVKGGIDWLVATQKADGSVGGRNYEHPVAVMALAEAYAMTNDPKLKGPAQSGVDHILKRQIKSKEGYPLGWNYTSPNTTRNDSSVTGWNVMALKSAKAGNLNVGNGLSGSKKWLEASWKAANKNWKNIGSGDSSFFPYTWDSGTGETKHDSRVPMGALSAVFLGYRAGDPMLESMGNYIMKNQVPKSYPTNTYYMYYNTLAIFQMGGNRWKEWNNVARDVLVKAQRTGGDCFDGSWDWEKTGFHGHETGRLLSTAYCCLSLEVYYRYLPVAAQKH
nr:terpene cyclase/mutase family protein [Planctomycetota bacterium]